MNQAPHPNAAKLFVNWIVTREGQEVWHSTQRTVSLRVDVDSSRWAPAYVIPRPGVDYFDSYGWDFTLDSRDPKDLDALKKLIGR